MPQFLDSLASVSIVAAAILLLSIIVAVVAYRLPLPFWTIIGESVAIVAGIAALYGFACFAWACLGDTHS